MPVNIETKERAQIAVFENGMLRRIFVQKRNDRTDHATPLYPQTLALTSPTRGGRSVGIVRSQTKATELVRERSKIRGRKLLQCEELHNYCSLHLFLL
jgi:hypothetical protein